MSPSQVSQLYARISAREPRAFAYYQQLVRCARAGNAKCAMQLRQLQAYGLLQRQRAQEPQAAALVPEALLEQQHEAQRAVLLAPRALA